MIPLFFLLATIAPLPDAGSVSSTNASYDGNALLLNGHVVLDHGLGKMTAEEASLQKQEVGKDFPFSVIELRKEVHLALKNSAELFCETADLDFNALTGNLCAKEGSKVVYSDMIKKKKGAVPLKLMGDQIELTFSKTGAEGKKTDYEVDTVQVKEDVRIDYAALFHLDADHALYRTSSQKTKEFQGVVTAYPKDSTSSCRLTHKDDVIDADMIDLDLLQSTISLLRPRGTLSTTFLPHATQEPMHFQADHLLWDHTGCALKLRGAIQIEEAALGTVTAVDEMQLIHGIVKEKPQLKSIKTQGHTTLVYNDPSSTRAHKLVCFGTMDIDRDKLHATLESPEKNGQVSTDKQLYYEEETIGVFADTAHLEYALTDTRLRPVSLSLKGHIRFFSHDPKQPPRCGIADRMNYSLTTHTLILAANPGRSVLFWDEAQGVRMSASEVHITQDHKTHQSSVKGVGKVHLSLSPEEQQHLKQLFPYYQVSYE